MRNFIRKKEDFVCEKCGLKVAGDGYTDHCPNCFWGKHVDEKIPGDRKSECKGLMRPMRAIYGKGRFKIFYECEDCDHEFRVREGKTDDRNKLLKLIG